MPNFRQLLSEYKFCGLLYEKDHTNHLLESIDKPNSEGYKTIRKWHNPLDVKKIFNHFETSNGIIYNPEMDEYIHTSLSPSKIYCIGDLFPVLKCIKDDENIEFIDDTYFRTMYGDDFMEEAEKRKSIGPLIVIE